MKRSVSAVVLAAMVAVSSGCATVRIEGATGEATPLIEQGKEAAKTVSFKTWYIFWGLMPLGEYSIAQEIRAAGFKSVRVEVKEGLDDWIMSMLGIVPFIPFSRTVYLHGN